MSEPRQYTPSLQLMEKIHRLREVLPSLREQYGVGDVWLFGSYVRREETADSDLDVLVRVNNPQLSLIEFIQIEEQLSDLLAVKIDLVEEETLKPTIRQHIIQEAVAI